MLVQLRRLVCLLVLLQCCLGVCVSSASGSAPPLQIAVDRLMGAFARADVGIAAGTACVNAWKENIKSCGDNAALAKTAARDMEEFVERLERGRKTNEENKTEGAEGLKELWAAKKLQELRELVRGANEMITKTDSTVVGLRNSIAVLRVAPADCLTSKEELVSLAREIGGEAERHARDLSLDSENMNKFVLVVFNRTNVLQVRGREIEEQQAKARGVANLADKGARDVEAAIKRARTQVEVANSAIPWGALEEVQEAQKDKEGPKEGFENIAGGTERKSKDGELLVGDAEKKSEILAVPEIVKEVKKTKENQRIADEKKSAEEATAQSRREAGDQQHAAKGKEEQKKAKEEAEQAKEAEKEAKMSEEEVKGITEKVESKAKVEEAKMSEEEVKGITEKVESKAKVEEAKMSEEEVKGITEKVESKAKVEEAKKIGEETVNKANEEVEKLWKDIDSSSSPALLHSPLLLLVLLCVLGCTLVC